ncbi:Non-reducing end alpha-L-arabinofuranosidase [Micromonospora saelicesensis]|uniref:arabinosylfuranosidase ArfA n=1 Tax=Micromonospora saelicesensis TaxID=285676 RepID=UPI000DBF4FC8|nr:alpha-N-arabinofuranosidase [Micromonospora saelicesensis]RAO51744.1 Non-reducing end alpha-L-arabinofuranosidase [Micromonospora saelicesensis]
MHTARLTVDPRRRVAPVPRRLFGSFVEHLGRCVYNGIYEPGHPTADADGFRSDVLELVRELGVTTVRYPGGNFVSSYRWEDGVGPVDKRPARLDLAWHSLETNEFGLDEFMRWVGKAGVDPIMAVNLGTRGTAEAVDLLEYANHRGGSHLADQRRDNGAVDPYGIKLWCLGNEMDGPWQVGQRSATEYGRLAAQTAKAMRRFDPDLELVACGSSHLGMPTFGSWERDVLTEAYDDVDLISLHAYYQPVDDDLASFLASAEDMDRYIDAVTAIADSVGAIRRSAKKIMIAFDEWNVWYQSAAPSTPPSGEDWPVAPPLLEDHYSVADAVVVGGLLISLLRHSDRVSAACQAQLVNVIAPIMTEVGGSAWRQTIFHPFARTARHAQGTVLDVLREGSTTTTDRYGEIDAVDAVSTWDDNAGEMTVFLVNRALETPAEVTIDVAGAQVGDIIECVTVGGTDLHAKNTADGPDHAAPRPNGTARGADASVQLTLPPASWTMLRLRATDTTP